MQFKLSAFSFCIFGLTTSPVVAVEVDEFLTRFHSSKTSQAYASGLITGLFLSSYNSEKKFGLTTHCIPDDITLNGGLVFDLFAARVESDPYFGKKNILSAIVEVIDSTYPCN